MVIDATANESFLEIKHGVLHYKGNPFTGELVAYFDAQKSIPKLSCAYVKGHKDGAEKIWHSNGVLSSERKYSNNVKVGIHKAWWSSGKKKFEYIFNDFGEYSGVLKEWFENGNLYREFHYSKGKEEGSQKMWKINGDIRANYVVRNGEIFGLIGMKKCDPVSTN